MQEELSLIKKIVSLPGSDHQQHKTRRKMSLGWRPECLRSRSLQSRSNEAMKISFSKYVLNFGLHAGDNRYVHHTHTLHNYE